MSKTIYLKLVSIMSLIRSVDKWQILSPKKQLDGYLSLASNLIKRFIFNFVTDYSTKRIENKFKITK